MRILIAGGTGLIGQPLIRSLVSNGHTVVVLSRSGRKIPASPGISWMTWDAKTTSGWGSIINEIDGVINLAGENIGRFPWSEKNKQQFRQSRLDAGYALVKAIEECQVKPRVFIQASAVGYYGPHGDEWVDESVGAGDDFSASLCLDWEASTQAVEKLGLRRILYPYRNSAIQFWRCATSNGIPCETIHGRVFGIRKAGNPVDSYR